MLPLLNACIRDLPPPLRLAPLSSVQSCTCSICIVLLFLCASTCTHGIRGPFLGPRVVLRTFPHFPSELDPSHLRPLSLLHSTRNPLPTAPLVSSGTSLCFLERTCSKLWHSSCPLPLQPTLLLPFPLLAHQPSFLTSPSALHSLFVAVLCLARLLEARRLCLGLALPLLNQLHSSPSCSSVVPLLQWPARPLSASLPEQL